MSVTYFRKQIILPTEHGSWSWLLVPLFVGAGVAGVWNTAVTLILLGALAAFLMRQPASVWLRVQQGRARQDNGPIALGWLLGFGGMAAGCLIGLLMMGHGALLWLFVPITAVLLIYLIAVRQRRSLGMELTGAAILAVTAAAVLVVVDGRFTAQAIILGALMAAQNVLGALYVRLRIADTHKRPINRTIVFITHLIIFILCLVTGFINITPLLAALPFFGILLRASWARPQPRPIANIKSFGFAEIGVEIASGLLIVISYRLV
jgi:hypothetical protein